MFYIKSTFKLATFLIIAIAILSVINSKLTENIANNKEEYELSNLSKSLNIKKSAKKLRLDKRLLSTDQSTDLGFDIQKDIIFVSSNNEIIALLIPSKTNHAYNDKINMTFLMSVEGEILDIKISDHAETTGIVEGVIEKNSEWMSAFFGLDITDIDSSEWPEFFTSKRFDALTGATITSKAIKKRIYETIKFYKGNKEKLLTLEHHGK
jgi:RnfABCDGE-type electron transport complex G subunit